MNNPAMSNLKSVEKSEVTLLMNRLDFTVANLTDSVRRIKEDFSPILTGLPTEVGDHPTAQPSSTPLLADIEARIETLEDLNYQLREFHNRCPFNP